MYVCAHETPAIIVRPKSRARYRVCTLAYGCARAPMYAYVHTRVRPHMLRCAPTCTLVCGHVRPYAPTYAHTLVHGRSHMPTLAHAHAHVRESLSRARGQVRGARPCAHVRDCHLRVVAGLSIAHVAAQHRTDGQEVGAPAIAHNASAATPTTRRDGQECRP